MSSVTTLPAAAPAVRTYRPAFPLAGSCLGCGSPDALIETGERPVPSSRCELFYRACAGCGQRFTHDGATWSWVTGTLGRFLPAAQPPAEEPARIRATDRAA